MTNRFRVLIGKYAAELQLSLYVFLDFELTALIQEEKFLSLVSGFDSDCDVDPDPSFREIMKDVEIFGNTVLSVLTLVLHTSRTAFGWNRIQLLLPDYETKILCIKPSLSKAPDKRVWLGTKSGDYTVKSGYYTAVVENNDDERRE
ncbi:hypothetical protein Bca4012_048404 [Brassica carinata]